METQTRYARPEDAQAIIDISSRVQAVFTESGSLQQIGPLERSKVEHAIKNRRCFVLEKRTENPADNRIIGCSLTKEISKDEFNSTEDLDMASFPTPLLLMGSIMLDPEFQRQGLGVGLVKSSIEHIKQDQSRHGGTLLLDCWAGAHKLRAYYTKVGFTFAAVSPEEDYEVAVFYIPLHASGE